MIPTCRCYNCFKGLPADKCLNKDFDVIGYRGQPQTEEERLAAEALVVSKLENTTRDLNEANIKIVRLVNLLGDIVAQATNDPAKLTAFNSPLLQLAALEVYHHNNPDEPVDEKSYAIFRQMAMTGFNG